MRTSTCSHSASMRRSLSTSRRNVALSLSLACLRNSAKPLASAAMPRAMSFACRAVLSAASWTDCHWAVAPAIWPASCSKFWTWETTVVSVAVSRSFAAERYSSTKGQMMKNAPKPTQAMQPRTSEALKGRLVWCRKNQAKSTSNRTLPRKNGHFAKRGAVDSCINGWCRGKRCEIQAIATVNLLLVLLLDFNFEHEDEHDHEDEPFAHHLSSTKAAHLPKSSSV